MKLINKSLLIFSMLLISLDTFTYRGGYYGRGYGGGYGYGGNGGAVAGAAIGGLAAGAMIGAAASSGRSSNPTNSAIKGYNKQIQSHQNKINKLDRDLSKGKITAEQHKSLTARHYDAIDNLNKKIDKANALD